MPVDRNAEKARAALVLADRQQGAAERRAQQRRHDPDRDGEKHQHEIIEGAVVAENVDFGEAEIDRHALPAGQPVIAAGDRVPAIGDEIEHLAEGDRHHREIDAAQAHDQHADDRRGDGPGDHADRDAGERVRDQVFDRQAGAVDAEAEIGGVAERQNAGEAQQEIQRHRRQRQHQHLAAQRRVAADPAEPIGHGQQQQPDRDIGAAPGERAH